MNLKWLLRLRGCGKKLKMIKKEKLSKLKNLPNQKIRKLKSNNKILLSKKRRVLGRLRIKWTNQECHNSTTKSSNPIYKAFLNHKEKTKEALRDNYKLN